ncbi:serine/threonine protein kinase [Martiniozyma asiatica (nom. inval.)]|nr:serine/threonine protein kinase [Martiniozyma asiatica]
MSWKKLFRHHDPTPEKVTPIISTPEENVTPAPSEDNRVKVLAVEAEVADVKREEKEKDHKLKPGLLTVKVYYARQLAIPLPLRINKPILHKLASLGQHIDESHLNAQIDALDDSSLSRTNIAQLLPSTLKISAPEISYYNLVYAVIEVENSSERIPSQGSTVSDTKFNTVTTFDITSPNNAILSVQIYVRIPGSLLDSDHQEDHLIGSFSYKLSDVLSRHSLTGPTRLLDHGWLNLKNPYSNEDIDGALNITLDFKPLSLEKQLTIDDFELLQVIGKGSFGKVMQVKKKDTGKIYALKSIRKAHIVNKMEVTHTLAEKFVLSRVNSPFIVPLKFAFQSTDKLYFVLSFVNGGELFYHLQQVRHFPLIRAKFYICELLSAISTLHGLNIVYRDLKPENILLDYQGHIALCDFGLCKINMKNDQKTNTFCGTPEYLAPELLLSKGYTRVVDFWTIGVLLYEMITSLPPFYDEDVNKMYQKILKAPLTFPDYVDSVTSDLIKKLLNRNPDERLGANGVEEIKSHPFFKDIDWEKLDSKGYIPPFRPHVKDASDIGNISKEFTMEKPLDSVVDEVLSESVQKQFGGWTYVGSFN